MLIFTFIPLILAGAVAQTQSEDYAMISCATNKCVNGPKTAIVSTTDPEIKYGAFCCSSVYYPSFYKKDLCEVYVTATDRLGNCIEPTSYQNAKAICEAQFSGSRLCTNDEYLNNCTTKAQKTNDNQCRVGSETRVWSSSKFEFPSNMPSMSPSIPPTSLPSPSPSFKPSQAEGEGPSSSDSCSEIGGKIANVDDELKSLQSAVDDLDKTFQESQETMKNIQNLFQQLIPPSSTIDCDGNAFEGLGDTTLDFRATYVVELKITMANNATVDIIEYTESQFWESLASTLFSECSDGTDTEARRVLQLGLQRKNQQYKPRHLNGESDTAVRGAQVSKMKKSDGKICESGSVDYICAMYEIAITVYSREEITEHIYNAALNAIDTMSEENYANVLTKFQKLVKGIDSTVTSGPVPTPRPSAVPTEIPSDYPTNPPPTPKPSAVPTPRPSAVPTQEPSRSIRPTLLPSLLPTQLPSLLPTQQPSLLPTQQPSFEPSAEPSESDRPPSARPSLLAPCKEMEDLPKDIYHKHSDRYGHHCVHVQLGLDPTADDKATRDGFLRAYYFLNVDPATYCPIISSGVWEYGGYTTRFNYYGSVGGIPFDTETRYALLKFDVKTLSTLEWPEVKVEVNSIVTTESNGNEYVEASLDLILPGKGIPTGCSME